MQLTENTGRKNLPSAYYCTTLSGYVFATKAYIDNWKKLIKQQYLLQMSTQYGELQSTNGWDRLVSLGHPANFNEFCILASLLHQCRWMEVNQTLHDVWLSPGLVHYIYIFGGSCPLMEFCQVQKSFCIQFLHSPILAALLCSTQAVGEVVSSRDRASIALNIGHSKCLVC